MLQKLLPLSRVRAAEKQGNGSPRANSQARGSKIASLLLYAGIKFGHACDNGN